MAGYTPPASPVGPGSAVKGFAITKSDSTVFAGLTRYIYVGGVGDLAVLLAGDTVPVTLSAVPTGTLLPLCCQKVMSTGTTATLLIGLL